ncbi:MAG: M28 family metallopeptidase [Coprobacillaceae bacterium]
MKNVKELVNQHMLKLCNEIGARATGSKSNQEAVMYASKVFEELGLKVIKQEFECMDWENEGGLLEVDNNNIEVEAAEYSLPCDVKGETICIDTISKLKETNITGKICILYGELCKETLMPKSFTFWNPEEHQEIIRTLETKKPLAIITVSYLEEVAVSIIQDGDFMIPCATIKGKYLNTILKSNTIHLQLLTKRKPSISANIIATYGTGNQKVAFSAHIDTKPTTPGALDNASGVATLLALAAQIVENEYPYQIEFALFNGEDYYSTPGEMIYMNSYLQHSEDYICAFNVDGVGMKDSKTSFSFYECPENLQNDIRRFSDNYKTIEEIEPWPMGDHMLYASVGIPAIAMTASKIFMLMESVMHTPEDNLSIVDMEKIIDTILFLQGCI